MATELTGESNAGGGGEVQKAVPSPFLTKTYQLVDDPAVDDFISWNEDGSGFIIWKPAEFARDLLPKYFKHNNLSSFVRQLNTYGFRKVIPDRWEFANDCFKKGEKRLLCDIQRRKITTTATSPVMTLAAAAPSTVKLVQQISPSHSGEEQTLSSKSSPGVKQVTKCTSPELVEENERLRKENQQMTNELSHLRGLCNNIFMMMSNYGPSEQQNPGNPSMVSKQLDLLQSDRYSEEQGGSSGGAADDMDEKNCGGNTSPKLFGVSIGYKRVKRCEDSESDERQQQDDALTENNSKSGNKAQFEMKLELSESGFSCS